MVRLVQLASLVFLPLSALSHPYDDKQTVLAPSTSRRPAKSIAIVGAGSGGLAVLKTIFDLPEDVRRDWEVVLYEQRRGLGGLWLPDPPGPLPHFPNLPESPTYPLLRTNTPHPTMTYINFTYPPNTPLFPTWDYVQQYHVAFADHYNISQYIHLRHQVTAANWVGNAEHGKWDLEVHVQDPDGDVAFKRAFDHLIVANGHNHYPNIPQWNGTDEWLAHTPAGTPQREIMHSIYYRRPERYANRTVIIIGAGASGRDAALQVGKLARVTYQSLTPRNDPTPGAHVIPKPRIAHFNRTSVIFEDGTALHDVDSLILGTGYEFRIPFLSPPYSSVLAVDKHTPLNSTTARSLVTNLRYIFPTHRHIFSLHPDIPPTALSFIGLPVLVANCPSDIAQSLLVTHAIANASILPSRAKLLEELVAREEKIRAAGLDPYYVGHRLIEESETDQNYQDSLVEYLKDIGALPQDGKKFVEPWRRLGRNNSRLLSRAWDRVAKHEEESKWLDGVKSEDEWADLMSRLTEWQRAYEEEHGVPEFEDRSVW